MKLLAMVLTLALAVAGLVLATGSADAQDDRIILRLTTEVAEGFEDPEPDLTDFTFVAPSFGAPRQLKTGAAVFIPVSANHEFTMTQEALDGWELASAGCTGTTDVTVDGLSLQGVAQGEDVTCTFTNRPIGTEPATLTVTKSVVGTDPMVGGTPFTFTQDENDATNMLRDGESFTVSFTPPTISVTEASELGWIVSSFECDGAARIVSSTLLQAHTIFAGPGDEVSCTYVNEPLVIPQVTVIKRADVPTDQRFDFVVNGGTASFDLGQNNSVVVEANPGTVTIAETPVAGWQSPQITCGDQASIIADEVVLSLGSGENVTCTFVNRIATGDVRGDVNCDGILNILDAFQTSEFVVQLRTGANGCPLADPSTEINLDAVSIDGAEVRILDAFRVSQCVVGLSNLLCPEGLE